MRMALFVNDIMTQEVGFTNSRLAISAINRGHEAWVINADSFKYAPDDRIIALAKHAPKKSYKSAASYLADLQGPKAKTEEICVDDLDILLLRSDPSEDVGGRAWAQSVGINFGRVAMRHGVIVLNDPNGLAKAINKMYFQLFPEEIRPRTIITRNKAAIKQFAKDEGGNIVLKSLQSSSSQGVFLVRKDELSNLNQIIDALSEEGYIIAQEYLPAAAKGDTRLFLMNGQPLKYKNKYAAFRRDHTEEVGAGSLHQTGGIMTQTDVTDNMLELAEMVRPKLVQDGMFFVRLDIVGKKIMEINVFSPGGLGSAQKFEGVNFTHAVIDALERKVDYMKYYRRNFDNIEMATL
ncbi:MAG: glutathione synthetase [Candidatus Melainabacteria bacterium]|nr:glutathione synthetase [Candidatus Melainabacteria bacterium]